LNKAQQRNRFWGAEKFLNKIILASICSGKDNPVINVASNPFIAAFHLLENMSTIVNLNAVAFWDETTNKNLGLVMGLP